MSTVVMPRICTSISSLINADKPIRSNENASDFKKLNSSNYKTVTKKQTFGQTNTKYKLRKKKPDSTNC